MDNQETDQALMAAYITGDESAFQVIYGRYSGQLYSYLQKKLKNREEVDEVFQKAFMKFHSTRHNYNSKYPLLQWLYVVSKTTLIDHYRSQGRQIKTEDLSFEVLNSLAVSQDQGTLALMDNSDVGFLSSLTNEQRKAIEMRVLDEASYEEIARALNKSQASVRQMISRAFKNVRGAT